MENNNLKNEQQCAIHDVRHSIRTDKYGNIYRLNNNDVDVCRRCRYDGMPYANALCEYCCKNNNVNEYYA